MASNRKVLVLPGDGIGIEVMRQVHRVVDWFDKRRTVSFDVKEGLVGGAAIDKHGWPIDDATMVELLEPMRPHRYRVVRLLEVSGLAYEPRRGPRLPVQHISRL
jgi:hypothetical protein